MPQMQMHAPETYANGGMPLMPDASVDPTESEWQWHVQTDEGWVLWKPLSNKGHAKPIPEIGEELQHRSANGRWKYISILLTENDGFQRNIETGAERHLRRVQHS